jgi:hypothetical protein
MHTFTTPAPVTTVLDVPGAHISLTAADRADTTVEVLPADPARSRDVKAAGRTAVDHADGVLSIRTAPAENRILGDTGSVRVVVHLPAGSVLRAKAADARLHSTGRLGEVTLDAARATVELDHTAEARLTLMAGDVSLARLEGSARISTSQGDIAVTEAVRGTVELSTESGSISIGAAPGVSASLDAGTPYGRIHNALRNDGAPDLHIRATTAYGDITARSL